MKKSRGDHQKPVGKKMSIRSQQLASSEAQAILLHISDTGITRAEVRVTLQSFSPFIGNGFSLWHFHRINRSLTPECTWEYPMLVFKLSACAIAQTSTVTVIAHALLEIVHRVGSSAPVTTVVVGDYDKRVISKTTLPTTPELFRG